MKTTRLALVLLSMVTACASSERAAAGPAGAEPAGPAETSGDDALVSPSPAAAGGDAPDEPWAAAMVDAHARRRAAHCAPPLAWSQTLASQARQWADHLASSGCRLEHSQSAYGENLAGGTSGTLGPDAVVDLWYAEGAHYDYRRGGFSMQTGHFTQLVWTTSTSLGCAQASCDGLDIVVCNYDPPGNYEGEFQAHVLPTHCR